MAIKALIFDLEGVMLQTVDEDLPTTLARQLGRSVEEVRPAFYSEINDQVDLGHGTQEDFWDHVLRSLGLPQENRHILEKFYETELYIDPNMLEAVRSYRKSYKTGLLSNYTCDLRNRLATHWSVDGAFDEIIISCEVGLIKPDPAIYRLMLERMGCSAEESLFVDDKQVNIDGAAALGMKTVLFHSVKQGLSEIAVILASRG
jgi:epoxide hydrolase-like predicted phosphatase